MSSRTVKATQGNLVLGGGGRAEREGKNKTIDGVRAAKNTEYPEFQIRIVYELVFITEYPAFRLGILYALAFITECPTFRLGLILSTSNFSHLMKSIAFYLIIEGLLSSFFPYRVSLCSLGLHDILPSSLVCCDYRYAPNMGSNTIFCLVLNMHT